MRTELRSPMNEVPPLHHVTPRPVVLLRREGTPHRFAWARALQLAGALGTSLVEVRLLDESGRRPARSLDWIDDVRARWERRFGRRLGPRSPMVLLPCDGTSHLARALVSLRAQVVVLGATPGWPADSVVALATESGVPCVLARSPHPAHAVIASSSLLDPRLPVVRQAATIAEALHRPLTVHHHVEPDIVQAERPHLEPQVEALARARGADIALTHGGDAVSSILSVAQAADADVIVVGASVKRPEASHLIAPRVAALAPRSVMIVPTAA